MQYKTMPEMGAKAESPWLSIVEGLETFFY